MILLLRNTEAQHHHIEKGRLGQLNATGAVIVPGVELDLVDPAAVIVPLQQRRVATTVAVGRCTGDQLQLRTIDTVQLDSDRAPRAAVCGIQNVSSQTSH